jgi:anti-sigma B factor antagonist
VALECGVGHTGTGIPTVAREGGTLELNIIQSDDTLTHVALTGRLDALGVQQVGIRFQGATASRGKPTIIDLSKVEFIASLGLGMLLTCARSLHGRGARAVIVNPQPMVKKALETAHMDSIIPVVHSVAEAEAALK